MSRLFGLVPVLLVPVLAVAQSVLEPAQTETTTIHVTSRIVYVDVIVRDKSGHIVHGLTQQDFRLQEDGKPQTIDFFTPHTYDMAAAERVQKTSIQDKSQPVGGATEFDFSNTPPPGQLSGAVNIILFDLANTPQEDQLEARKQLVKFLQALPGGQQVALFVLTTRLQMIQNFTGSSDRLREAARGLDPKDYGLILSKAAAMEADDVAAEFKIQSGGGLGGKSSAMENQIAANNRADSITRANITVAALGDLARATSGYPGRKNLLWLSESFPIALGEQLDETRYVGKSTVPGAREAANLIASAQIAVYPISLLGLEVEGVGPAASGVSGVILGGGNGATIDSQFNGRQALKTEMSDLAEQTGGEAFAGTNDFAEAMRRSMNDGSNYYALAYQPHNQKWNGQFRKIRVELATRGYSISYRRGYFAYPDSITPTDGKKELTSALQPGTPESTMLLLRSKIELPGTPRPEVSIDSALDPGNISFVTDAAGHRHAQLLVVLVAFQDSVRKTDAQTAPPPETSGVLTLDLSPEQYEALANKGIVFHQQLHLSPGRYRLRLGVSDLGNRRIGTLDMPIEVSQN